MAALMSVFVCAPTTPAAAQRGTAAAVAAGIVGAAVILGARPGRAYYAPSKKYRKAKGKSGSGSKTASNPKDPFAGAVTPAGYATPVSNSANAAK
jgi:hypothetical protein